MKVSFLQLGKTDQNYLAEGIRIYSERIKHYISFEILTLKELKKSKSQDINNFKRTE
jgi:23S rRNA (pseudouridine1915-N3)-methyltransferase